MANYTTGAERYNNRMNKIFDKYVAQREKAKNCPHLHIVPHIFQGETVGSHCADCYLSIATN